jgi:hypothetical protein
MPTSNLTSFFDIMEVISQIKAKSILDVGVGFGKWGFLIREYFDLRPHKKKGYDDWSLKLDGIEVNEKYITPVHNYIYNNMFIGEALDILSNNNVYYELILALDIVEHFSKENGLKFITLCRNRSDFVFINTPNIYYKIENEYYSHYMEHKSGWDADDFTKLGAKYVWHSGIYVLAIFTEHDLSLPLENNIQEYNFENIDLIKIRELIQMYYNTSQIQECMDACEKYSKIFPDDNEFQQMISLCHKKLDGIDKAR